MDGLLFIGGFLVLGIWLWIKQHSADIGSLDDAQLAADECLRKTFQDNPAYGFDGAEIQIMECKPSWSTINDTTTSYSCQYLVRNSRGEYFLFIYRHDEPPYIKPTSQNVAHAMLGRRYLGPPGADDFS